MRCLPSLRNGDNLLFIAAALVVIFARGISAVQGQDFSIHKAESIKAQEPPKDADKMNLSIFQDTTPPIVEDDSIQFSVHNAKPMNLGDEPKALSKMEFRRANRVLVFHATKPVTETIRVTVCDEGIFGRRCRVENRLVTRPPASSVEVVKTLKTMEGWVCEPSEEAHWVFVDVDDVKNANLVKELKVNRAELPILIKETDPTIRKKATGISQKTASDWWNDNATDPRETKQKPKEQQTQPSDPNFGQSDHRWTYPGNIRQHLTDPRFPHHLPKAVIDTWSDEQCEKWHAWHHDVLEGTIPASKASSATSPLTSGTSKVSRTSQTPSNSTKVPSRYISGNSLEAHIYQIANNAARAPPMQRPSLGKDGKKTKDEKRWRESERKRIRREVNRQVWSQYSTFDPFTILSIILTIIKILSFIFDAYNLN